MSGAKEIRTKIDSIKKTQKTTKAMEMVAASKMRKAQQRMSASKPYARKIEQVIRHLAHSKSEYHHPFLQTRPIKRVGYIIVATDRGLCGGLNVNLFRTVINDLKSKQEQNLEVDVCLIGRKAEVFFRRIKANILGTASHLGDNPSVQDLIGVVKIMLNAYDEGKIDVLYIVSNEFINTMSQKPYIQQLIPLPKTPDQQMDHYWDYIYEPDSKLLIDHLLQRYMEMQVYQAVMENLACQQAATMVAMKSASDNAGELIREFQLAYNKARQAAITQEISEIVGGAAAV